MGYCRFENTYRDFLDCVEALEEGDLTVSEDEREAYEMMLDLLDRFRDAPEPAVMLDWEPDTDDREEGE
jgi:hypothetical protein